VNSARSRDPVAEASLFAFSAAQDGFWLNRNRADIYSSIDLREGKITA
jgi:hypothetical protein